MLQHDCCFVTCVVLFGCDRLIPQVALMFKNTSLIYCVVVEISHVLIGLLIEQDMSLFVSTTPCHFLSSNVDYNNVRHLTGIGFGCCSTHMFSTKENKDKHHLVICAKPMGNGIGTKMACPHCWHRTCPLTGGIGTYSIQTLINHTGGVLDINGICSTCNFNIIEIKNCSNCTPTRPCSQHYASGHNGSLSNDMPVEMHNLYMRNSPYNQSWSQRPVSIGRWYAYLPTTYVEAIDIARRFTTDYPPVAAFNCLEHQLKCSGNQYQDFWQGFTHICQTHFSSSDKVSIAMASYHSALTVRNLEIYCT